MRVSAFVALHTQVEDVKLALRLAGGSLKLCEVGQVGHTRLVVESPCYSLPANASGLDPHRAPISSRSGQAFSGQTQSLLQPTALSWFRGRGDRFSLRDL